jgi:hypothetical protein
VIFPTRHSLTTCHQLVSHNQLTFIDSEASNFYRYNTLPETTETGSYSLFSNQHRLYHRSRELNFATLLRYFSYRERNDMKIIRLSRLIITFDGINRNVFIHMRTVVIGCYVKGFSSVHELVHKFPNNIQQIISFKMNLAFPIVSLSRIFVHLVPYYYLL